jgi:hypothetical protein
MKWAIIKNQKKYIKVNVLQQHDVDEAHNENSQI